MKFEDLSFSSEPQIKTTIPGDKSRIFLDKQSNLEGNIVSYPKGSPIAIQKAMGATIMDMDGNIFLDFFGGAGVMATGHCNPYINEAIKEVPTTLTHALDFPNKYRQDLVETILKVLPQKMRDTSKVAFGGPTGSDAVESAIKLGKFVTKRTPIIAFEGAYHGMTAGAASLNSGKFWKKNFIPMLPEVHFVPYAYDYRSAFNASSSAENAELTANFYEHVLDDPHSGVCDPALTIIEPIQGEGGSVVPHESFIHKIEQISRKYSVPVCFDEIQAGFCRTGKFFSCEHSNATPDIMTISKALGGGFPLSAIVYHEDLDQWHKAAHIGTFRGNIIAMAAGKASIDFMVENSLPAYAEDLGNYFLQVLKPLEQKSAIVGEVRGRGLMVAIEIVEDKESKTPGTALCTAIRDEILQHGVIIETGGHYSNVLRFLPPLILTRAQAKAGLAIIVAAIEKIEKARNH